MYTHLLADSHGCNKRISSRICDCIVLYFYLLIVCVCSAVKNRGYREPGSERVHRFSKPVSVAGAGFQNRFWELTQVQNSVGSGTFLVRF